MAIGTQIKDTPFHEIDSNTLIAIQQQSGAPGSSGHTSAPSVLGFINSHAQFLQSINGITSPNININPGAGIVISTDAYNNLIIGLNNGPLVLLGVWDASTNTPTLSDSTVAPSGNLYITSIAGTVNFGNGPIAFTPGDFVLSNGTHWIKIENSVQENADWYSVSGPSQILNRPADTSDVTPNSLVRRDGDGNFKAGTITATLSGNATSATTAITANTATTATNATNATNAVNATNATNAVNVTGAFSGDVTGTQSAMTIGNNTINNAKLVNMPATTLKGNSTASPASPSDLAVSDVRAMIGLPANYTSNTLLFASSNTTLSSALNVTYTQPSGVDTLNVYGVNPNFSVGTNGIFSQSTASGAYFLDSASGDINLRNSTSNRAVNIGVTGGNAQFKVLSGQIKANAPFTLQTNVSGASPTGLTYYEELSLGGNLTGAVTIVGYAINLVRQNNTVKIILQNFNNTAVITSNLTFSVNIPARYCPLSEKKFPIIGINNSQFTLSFGLTSSGVLTIYGGDDSGNFIIGKQVSCFGGFGEFNINLN